MATSPQGTICSCSTYSGCRISQHMRIKELYTLYTPYKCGNIKLHSVRTASSVCIYIPFVGRKKGREKKLLLDGIVVAVRCVHSSSHDTHTHTRWRTNFVKHIHKHNPETRSLRILFVQPRIFVLSHYYLCRLISFSSPEAAASATLSIVCAYGCVALSNLLLFLSFHSFATHSTIILCQT